MCVVEKLEDGVIGREREVLAGPFGILIGVSEIKFKNYKKT